MADQLTDERIKREIERHAATPELALSRLRDLAINVQTDNDRAAIGESYSIMPDYVAALTGAALERLAQHKAQAPLSGFYIMMMHGRSSPDENLDDWGSDGPVIGPFTWMHVTYQATWRLGVDESGDDVEMHFVADLLYYDGVYYGDWEVVSPEAMSDPLRARLAQFDEAKTVPPDQQGTGRKVRLPLSDAPPLNSIAEGILSCLMFEARNTAVRHYHDLGRYVRTAQGVMMATCFKCKRPALAQIDPKDYSVYSMRGSALIENCNKPYNPPHTQTAA